jgi:hypothetical protein
MRAQSTGFLPLNTMLTVCDCLLVLFLFPWVKVTFFMCLFVGELPNMASSWCNSFVIWRIGCVLAKSAHGPAAVLRVEILFFWDRVLLCNPGSPGTHYIAQTYLNSWFSCLCLLRVSDPPYHLQHVAWVSVPVGQIQFWGWRFLDQPILDFLRHHLAM